VWYLYLSNGAQPLIDPFFRWLQRHCSQFLEDKAPSAFDTVRQLQRFVSTLAFNQIVAPTTVWSPDMSTVQCRGIQLRILTLLDGVQSMAARLRHELYSLSDGQPIEYHVPEDFADDLTSTTRGTSWISSAHTLPREHALLHHMSSKGSCGLVEAGSDGQLQWNAITCQEFMCKAASIVDLIATLVHIGAGPPCRGTEQVEDQISNGIQPRTLYLSFGRFLTIRRHTKNTHASGLDAFNVCYYPKALTELITYYLLVVRPLERVIGEVLYGTNAAELYDIFLYVKHGVQVTSESLSDILQAVTKKAEHFGVPIGLNPLRHIMVAFQRAYVEESRVPRGDNIGDLISAHSSKTADAIYARESGLLEGMTASYLLDVREWCETYHDAIGLGTRTYPLIPLRTKRKLARQLGSIAHDPSDGGLVKALLDELQRSTFESVIRQLQPFIRDEIRSTFAESCTAILTEIAKSNIQKQSTVKSVPRPQPVPNRATVPARVDSFPTAQTPLPPAQAPLPPETPIPHREKRRLTLVYGSGQDRETSANKRQNMLGVTPTPLELSMDDLRHSIEQVDSGNPLHAAQPPSSSPSPSPPPQAPVTDDDMEVDIPMMPNSPDIESHLSTTVHPASPSLHDPLESDPNTSTSIEEPSTSAAGIMTGVSEPLSNLDTDDGPPDPPLSALEGLRKLLQDPSADFKSEAQEQLVNAVLDGRHTLAILPTGGGKSMAFEIPPVVQGRLTLVVVPYRLIIAQVVEDARRRGIKAERWVAGTARDTSRTRLVVVAVETILNNTAFRE
jgi:hypothetical protein